MRLRACNQRRCPGVSRVTIDQRDPAGFAETCLGEPMDEASFDDFYTTSFPRLVRQLHASIGDREEAADCVQEAFVKAWARRHQLDAAENPEAWIRTVAHRLAISRWRRLTRGRRPADRAHARPTFASPPSDDQVVLVSALRRLPEAQRQAIVLHHIADQPIEQVARELGVPEGTVKARLSRGRAALAALLDDSRLQGGATHV